MTLYSYPCFSLRIILFFTIFADAPTIKQQLGKTPQTVLFAPRTECFPNCVPMSVSKFISNDILQKY